MSMNDPFNSPAFNVTSLTEAINLLPNNYGRLRKLGLFTPKGITTRTVVIEEKGGILSLLQTKELGAPGTVAKNSKRKVRSFVVPHIPHDATIYPSDVQGLRGFGSESATKALASFVNEKQQEMRDKHAITLEWHRNGALKSTILDADGTVLYNLLDEFGIGAVTGFTNAKAAVGKKLTIDFKLSAETTDVKKKCLTVKRHIEANLQGETTSGIRVQVDSEFYDAFTSHPKVVEAFARWEAGAFLRDDMRDGFKFGDLIWEEDSSVATDGDGNIRLFHEASKGVAFPMGTRSTFRTYNAPADFNETVNTMGKAVYSKIEPRKFGRGWDIHTQSNPLSLCLRPPLTVNITST